MRDSCMSTSGKRRLHRPPLLTSGQQLRQHARQVTRGMNHPHDARRVGGVGIDQQIAVARDGPEPVARARDGAYQAPGCCRSDAPRPSPSRADDPQHPGCRGRPGCCGQLTARPPRREGGHDAALARRSSSMMPRNSASTSSVVQNPSRSLSASASPSEATKAARASSWRCRRRRAASRTSPTSR